MKRHARKDAGRQHAADTGEHQAHQVLERVRCRRGEDQHTHHRHVGARDRHQPPARHAPVEEGASAQDAEHVDEQHRGGKGGAEDQRPAMFFDQVGRQPAREHGPLKGIAREAPGQQPRARRRERALESIAGEAADRRRGEAALARAHVGQQPRLGRVDADGHVGPPYGQRKALMPRAGHGHDQGRPGNHGDDEADAFHEARRDQDGAAIGQATDQAAERHSGEAEGERGAGAEGVDDATAQAADGGADRIEDRAHPARRDQRERKLQPEVGKRWRGLAKIDPADRAGGQHCRDDRPVGGLTGIFVRRRGVDGAYSSPFRAPCPGS